jgi:hypothetical protein
MTHSFHELIVGGVLIAPILFYVALTLVLVMLLKPVLHLIGFQRCFSNATLAELSLYVVIFGSLVLLI